MQAVELKITIKNEEKKQTHSFLCYEMITVSPEDPVLQAYVKKATKSFQDPFEEVIVALRMIWE